jgi:hypothetical protein
MKNTNKLIRLVAVLCALLIMTVSGCSNGNDIKSKNDSQKKSYSVSGSINLLDTNDRSATTSFTRLDSLNYSVVAYKGTSTSYEENSAVTASLGGSASNITYSFKLPEAGNWYIVASAKLSIEDEFFVDILTGSKEVDVPDQMAAYNVDAITLNLTGFTENASGSIDLVIYDHTNKISKVDISAKALISKNSVLSQRKISKSGLTFTGTYEPGLTERTLTLEYEDISSDCYEIVFNFRDSNNKIIYSCKEAVTVLGGFVTDKWLQGSSGTGAHLVYDSYNNSTKFIITDELLNSYNQAGDLDYPVVLWNKREEEYTHTEIDDSGYMYTTLDKSFTLGIQAFGKITDETNITCNYDYIPYNVEENPVFCFDNNAKVSIYTLDNSYISRYKQSYSGYKFDEDFEIDLEELLSDAGVTSEQIQFQKSYTGIAFCDPYLFFFFKLSDSNVYIGAVDPEVTSDFMCGVLQNDSNNLFSVTSMAVDSIEMNGGDNKTILCYSGDSTYSDNQSLYIKALEFNGSSISLDSSINGALTSDMETGLDFAKITDRAIISDLYIWDNVLYVALCSYYMNSGSDTVYPYSNSYFEDAGEYYRRPIFVSNGGIAKVNLSNPNNEGDYEFADWSKLVEQGKYLTKVLGWKETTYYEFDEAANTYNLETDGIEARHVTIAPSLNESDQYFYGARKFIARKPDELVIADDGGYVDIDLDDSGNPKEGTLRSSENMNRVVTVDLKEEAITSVEDVNACFSLSFDTFNPGNSTFYGYGLKTF